MIEPLGNPAQTIAQLRTQLGQYVADFTQKQRNASMRGPTDPESLEMALAVQVLGQFVLPRLEEIAKYPPAEQGNFLTLMVPFDSKGGLRGFLLHFFQLDENAQGQLVYQPRDNFEREVYILHDLYKVKKTLEVIRTLRAAIGNPAKAFPSRFSPEEKANILEGLEGVLNLLFTQCLPPQFRHDLIQNLSPAYLEQPAILARREKNTLYSYPHILAKYDYRRFFFLIYFKNGMRAKIADQEREFRFNFLWFQLLKKEYLVHWLTLPLKNNPAKFTIYQKYLLRGKTLLAHIVEHPEREGELLLELPSPSFNDLVTEVNEEVAPDKRLDVVPESENFGLFQMLKEQLVDAVEMVKAPIEKLRAGFRGSRHEGQPAPAMPEVEEEAIPLPVAPPAPAVTGNEVVWDVHLLNEKQMGNPYLTQQMQQFGTMLNLIKAKMGEFYPSFSTFVNETLDNTPETSSIRRRTPKHEWAQPYLIRKITAGKTETWVLVLGAEAKAKPKGMGYSARETYAYTPYFVLATDAPGEGFGDPVGERLAAGHELREYSFNSPAVVKQVMVLMDKVRQKNARKEKIT